MTRIGLLGCGAIGTQIALAIDSGKIPATLTHVYDNSKDVYLKPALPILIFPEKNQSESLFHSTNDPRPILIYSVYLKLLKISLLKYLV